MEQKNPDYRQLLCQEYCPYHKPLLFSDTFTCYGFILVQEVMRKYPQCNYLLSSPLSGPKCVYHYDPYLSKLICQKCDFLKDGCDFRAQKHMGQNKNCSPCGGYIFITRLIGYNYFMITSHSSQLRLRPV